MDNAIKYLMWNFKGNMYWKNIWIYIQKFKKESIILIISNIITTNEYWNVVKYIIY